LRRRHTDAGADELGTSIVPRLQIPGGSGHHKRRGAYREVTLSAFRVGLRYRRLGDRLPFSVALLLGVVAYRNFKRHFSSSTALYAPHGASSIS